MLIDHVDIHTADLDGTRKILDGVLPALGLPRILADDDSSGYYPQAGDQPFVYVVADGPRSGGTTRVAFAGRDRAHVDQLSNIARERGAREIEGPQLWTEYSGNYYAVFFEDESGNKFEICYRS